MKSGATEEAYEKSIKLLRDLSIKQGFVASTEKVTNYKRIWGRDGAVAIIASLASGDKKLVATSAQTLRTLKEFQDKTGRIPSNIEFDGNKATNVSYGSTVGRIDATMWYIIAVCQYVLHTGDKGFFAEFHDSIKEARFYLECLELNGNGLIYFPQGADWADEYINHGYILFDQVLNLLALESYYRVVGDVEILKKIDYLRKLILVNYFPDEEDRDSKYVYNEILFNVSMREYDPPLPIAYFTTHSARHHIDNFANGLLLLSRILDSGDSVAIKDTVIEKFLSNGFPILPAFSPVIEEGDRHWDKLMHHYRFNFKNKPYNFHNGGLWPLVHGFFLANLEGKDGEEHLEKFAQMLKKDDYIFPEFYNGKTHEPGGTKHLGFSAAAYVIAYEAIMNKRPPFILSSVNAISES